MEAGKYTTHLYGCENNEHRYTLAKCNFILNDFDTNNLKYNSCFNEQYRCEYDKIIVVLTSEKGVFTKVFTNEDNQ